MRVLGIDPGTVVTGYGVIDEEDQRLFYVASDQSGPRDAFPRYTR